MKHQRQASEKILCQKEIQKLMMHQILRKKKDLQESLLVLICLMTSHHKQTLFLSLEYLLLNMSSQHWHIFCKRKQLINEQCLINKTYNILLELAFQKVKIFTCPSSSTSLIGYISKATSTND